MDRERILESAMNPNSNPFTPQGKKYPCSVKPIDRANNEIKLLKKEIIELRKALEPLIAERNKRLIEEEREEPVVIDHKSWWFS